MGITLYREYEAVTARETLFTACPLTKDEREALPDAFLSVCHGRKVYYAWRPNLPNALDSVRDGCRSARPFRQRRRSGAGTPHSPRRRARRGEGLTRTFLDAGVLIAAIRGTPEIADRALALLNDPERLFVSSAFVQLEVLPKAVYFPQDAEVSFYRAYFASVAETVPVSQGFVSEASEQAQRAGPAALDALHVAAARLGGAAEFITVERPGKPLFRVEGLSVHTLLDQ
jgi:predicted nucleic acid-binding protein